MAMLLKRRALGFAVLVAALPAEAQVLSVTPEEARAIAKEAYLYAFPMVEAYKVLDAQAVDKRGENYKAPFNQIGNTAQLFTPKDTAIVTPNSDTPYSMMWMDLRAEPLVLTLPEIDPKRFYHVQLIDLYTQNFAYLGKRGTGSKGGNFLVAGPGWKGETPANLEKAGIAKVVQSETSIAYALYRTQLFGPADIENVKKIQAQYKVQPLSAFLKQAAPPAAPPIDWLPLDYKTMTTTPAIFRYLNLLLTFCPTDPSEKDLMRNFGKIGIGAGRPFDDKALPPNLQKALQDGIDDGVRAFEVFKRTELDTRKVGTAALFGTREHLKNNYLYRYAAAKLGIFGNSAEEAIYHGYFVDGSGAPLDAATKSYALTFAKDGMPPANAFWSITLYDGTTQLLVGNPLNRYLINSPMLPQLKRDPDGGLTLSIRKDSPGADKASNWLPAPPGPFYLVLRLYEPGPEALSGAWQVPPLRALD
jgi:hypothetical protein